jgi:molybdate transport system regulatory protein
MADSQLSIRIDLANGERIGPGKVDLLEAIRSTGSISAAARALGMTYRRAWLLVEDINAALRAPAVAAATGGRQGGGTKVTAVGEKLIALYRSIERIAHTSSRKQFHAINKLAKKRGKVGAKARASSV